MVIVDCNRHTGIVISQGPKYIGAVLMESGQLTTTRLTQEQYDEVCFKQIDYPLEKAIQIFINHPGGISEAARRALESMSMAALLD